MSVSIDKWSKQFRDPEAEYRSHPFWSWNELLDEDEIRQQVRLMAQSGQGGFFMHARDGLITPYMGKDWFDAVRAAADEAEKVGIEAWCYDERGWPSGSAGGVVPALGEKYRVKWIKMLEDGDKSAESGEILASFAVAADNSFRKADKEKDLTDGERLMHAVLFTGGDYIDILDPDVVEAFIRSTYDKYKDETGDALRDGHIKGFFTDEPQYALCKTPWTNKMEDAFSSSYGYSITDSIPALFLDAPDHQSVRYDFWMLVNRLFTESYAKQIFDWCEENGCRFTGHAMMEDTMVCQIHCTAGPMPMYEYMHVPGIDWLGRSTSVGGSDKAGSPVPPLQVGSVAAQLGKAHVISEMYALCGWNTSLSEMKYIAEWQFLYGVNMICEHLAPYSLRGDRKNDYPPAVFYQSPLWDAYKILCDTLSRLGKIMSVGRDEPGVLLIHPIHSIYLEYTNDDMCAEQPFDDKWNALTFALTECHIPHHYGDETILRKHGRTEGGSLIVGKQKYHTVILPSLKGIDRSTFDLLTEFAKGGGRVCAIGDMPSFIGGRRAERDIRALYAMCDVIQTDGDVSKEWLLRYFTDAGIKKMTVTGRDGEDGSIRIAVRNYPEDNRRVYFLLNTDCDREHKVTVRLPEKQVAELCLSAMEYRPVPGSASSLYPGETVVELVFEPMQSCLLVAGEGMDLPDTGSPSPESIKIPLKRQWRLGADSDPNCYMMDCCRVLAGDDVSDEMHVWSAGREVEGEKYLQTVRSGKPLGVRYSFTVDEAFDLSESCGLRLVLEFRQPVTVRVNGVAVAPIPGEWWLDHGFSVYDISNAVKNGVNTVDVTDFCHVVTERGRERIKKATDFGYAYLTGNFGVFPSSPFIDCEVGATVTDPPFVLGKRPVLFEGGNIVPQGHPFFRGKLVLEQDAEIHDPTLPRYVELDPPYAAYARVYVNGQGGELLIGGSRRTDVTGKLRRGINVLSVEMGISNRNLLGPHHAVKPESYSVGPEEFIPARPSRWQRRYSFVKAGLSD